jgi:hypothetical protein
MFDVFVTIVALLVAHAPLIGMGVILWATFGKTKLQQNATETTATPRVFVPMASPADLITGAANSPTLSCRAQPTSNAQVTYSGLNALDKLLD